MVLNLPVKAMSVTRLRMARGIVTNVGDKNINLDFTIVRLHTSRTSRRPHRAPRHETVSDIIRATAK